MLTSKFDLMIVILTGLAFIIILILEAKRDNRSNK